MSRAAVKFSHVDVVFGAHPEKALPWIDKGASRADIRKETGQVLGVADCSLEAEEGEILVLMGLSGSGKSTLLRTVNGLNQTVRGVTEVWDGARYVDPTRCSPADLRKLRMGRVAMVFQNFGLLPWRSVEANIAYGLELAGVPRAEIGKRVAAQLELVGLHGWGARRIDELSGGMQQRVGLARAFAAEAPILLMDEPFSALDPLIRAGLQDELLELQARLGRTIVFVSHDLDEAIKIGSRIVVMEGGRIIQAGLPQDIILNPATPYVSKFVAHANPLAVIRASDAMRPLAGGPLPSDVTLWAPDSRIEAGRRYAVSPDTTLKQLISLVGAGGGSVLVARDGQVVGEVDHLQVVNSLSRKN